MTTDPRLDLVFTRATDLPVSAVWDAWTRPELITQWFTPAPWQTAACELELKPGGVFRTVMRSPEGQESVQLASILEVVPRRRLVWTNALTPGFRPAPAPGHLGFGFTVIIELTPEGSGTRYTGTVLHADEASAKKHAAMGFQEGWGAAWEQLVALMKRQA